MKEYKILGDQYVKYSNPNDNEWVVERVENLTDEQLKNIVNNAVYSGKVIMVYEGHQPKDNRRVVGEIEEIKFDNGIIAGIKWNDLGYNILKEESRYPSVELAVYENGNYELMAVAMVGEPASKDVDLLELSAIESQKNKGGISMDDMIKGIVDDGWSDPETMRKQLTELVTEDPTKASLIIDAIADSISKFIETQQLSASSDSESDKESDKMSEEESDNEKDLESDVEIKTTDKVIDDDADDSDDDKKQEKLDLTSIELTAIANEYGAKENKGTVTSLSLTEAINKFISMKKNNAFSKNEKLDLFKSYLKFVPNSKPATIEELSIYSGKQVDIKHPSSELGDLMRG